MKMSGATWNAYMDSWPKGQWFDDSDETVNGIQPEDAERVPDDAVVEFSCGVVFESDSDRVGTSLTTHFRRWLRDEIMNLRLRDSE